MALSNNPGGSTLGGTVRITAQNGVAPFADLTLNKVGTGYTLLVTASGLASTTTDPFDVTPAAATQLIVMSQPPSDVIAGSTFELTVWAEIAYDNLDTNFVGSVTVGLGTNPGGATLGGTLQVTAQAGMVPFTDLTLNQPGIGYTLDVSSTGLTGATTNPFNVQTTVGSSVGVNWGTAGTDTFQTASDGLRLLPAGRSTDMPWIGIDQLSITLAQATTLASGDVTVSSAIGASYGPVSISGSGTSYTITLVQPVDKADRVTVTIDNATIVTFTRRLDVLPGDFNDDGVVNAQDLVGVRNEWLHVNGAGYTIFGDINGDGVVNLADYNDVRVAIGSSLPAVTASPAVASISLETAVGAGAVPVRIGTTGQPGPANRPVRPAPAAWTSARAEIHLAARGRGWSPGTSSKIGVLDRLWTDRR